MSAEFLAGQNVNFVLERIFSNLGQYGIDLNVKEEQPRIINFMTTTAQKYPNEQDMSKLNSFTVNALTKFYMQNRPGRENLASRMEQELMERRYDTRNNMQPQPPGLDSIGVAGAGGMMGGAGGMGAGGMMNGTGSGQMNLEQARRMGPPPPIQTSIRRGQDNNYIDGDLNGAGVGAGAGAGGSRDMTEDVREAAERERARRQAEDLSQLRDVPDHDPDQQTNLRGGAVRPSLGEDQRSYIGNGPLIRGLSRGQSASDRPAIWLSLQKDHLVDLSGNTFTFGWHSKTLQDLQGPIRIKLEYVTLPKYYPYLFLRFGKERQVFTGQGKSYTAKLVPVHSLLENTTYQIIGQGFPLDELPTNLSMHLTPPEGSQLDLNIVTVQRVTKQNGQIGIQTKYPHNLQPNDYLILEFPDQQSCYKVTNLKIVDQYQIRVDSPFSGYFSSNFRILRNNWDLDITMRLEN